MLIIIYTNKSPTSAAHHYSIIKVIVKHLILQNKYNTLKKIEIIINTHKNKTCL